MTADQEENLLQQLMEITRVMQEGQLVEGMVSERKAQTDWEGESTHTHLYSGVLWYVRTRTHTVSSENNMGDVFDMSINLDM